MYTVHMSIFVCFIPKQPPTKFTIERFQWHKSLKSVAKRCEIIHSLSSRCSKRHVKIIHSLTPRLSNHNCRKKFQLTVQCAASSNKMIKGPRLLYKKNYHCENKTFFSGSLKWTKNELNNFKCIDSLFIRRSLMSARCKVGS